MTDIAIRCEGLSKQYRIGERVLYKTFRDTLSNAATVPFRRLASAFSRSNGNHGRSTAANRSNESFWALDNVSIEIRAGEIVGVIGRNGAGKSTLLKLLSRITEPTRGRAEINGRVGSLLEVGTGFNPELTGRENIYLNGAILGMKKAEIERRFDEMVAFAGVEQFVDTPVKRYSSGMYLRLAFAVAAHLETEILLVDEVLAVGDAEFQRRCFSKIRDVGQLGRTILFVSHNMSAIRHICNTGVMLDRGCVLAVGEIDAIADQYLATTTTIQRMKQAVETPSFLIEDIVINRNSTSGLKTFEPFEFAIRITAKKNIGTPGLYIGVLTSDGQRISGLDFKDFRTAPPIKAGERAEIGFVIESLPLLHGTYQLELHLKDMASHNVEMVSELFPFEVLETPVYGGRRIDRWFGSVGLKARATFEPI